MHNLWVPALPQGGAEGTEAGARRRCGVCCTVLCWCPHLEVIATSTSRLRLRTHGSWGGRHVRLVAWLVID